MLREQRPDRARDLRAAMTDAERRLWFRLRDRRLLGFKFRRQVPIAGYIADFACLERRLAIEIDGSQHVEREAYDERRTEVLAAHGFTVLRVWNHDVLLRMEQVLEAIVAALGDRPSSAR